MEDYYPGEIAAVVHEWNLMHGGNEDTPEYMDPQEFLGGGGEML